MRFDRRAALAALAAAALAGPAAMAAVRLEDRIAAGGARLYLLVRGDDPRAPVLLWLHGGPGGPERPLFRLYNGVLEHRFVVAYLDQRGAGRSYDPQADPKALTIARHLADLDEVVDHLRRTLGRERVILVGHSWGSALGLLYAKAHPQKVAAVVGVAQVVAPLAADRAQVAWAEAEARRRGEAKALKTLAALRGPPFHAEDELKLEGLVDRYGGLYHHRPNFSLALIRAIAAGYVSPGEIPRMIHANNVSLDAMAEEVARLDLARDAPAVEVPVAFLLGRYDHHVDAGLAAAYFERLQAPAKQLMWFEGSAHNIPFEEPELFNAALPRVLHELGAA